MIAAAAPVELLVQNVFNCVRSAAGLAIGGLLWEHPGWFEGLRTGIDALINDPHPVPRMAAVPACLPVLRFDRDLAVSWFCAACQDDLRIASCKWAVGIFNRHCRPITSNYRRSFSLCADQIGMMWLKRVLRK